MLSDWKGEFVEELYAVERYVRIYVEGPSDSFFSNNETVVQAEVPKEPAEEVPDGIDKLIWSPYLAYIHAISNKIVDDTELMYSGIVIENNNDPV